ncbi:hypothetical protein G8A07_15570 [Roseateles sp. DAIF2]|uniref:phage tail terminator protein n=1 Tax=Roseateles sp. DAIF2 TaxID=2714952 RepID=UPI0018A27A62|nr:hypothetical protein [Roseateles sp. DAIF2]QPF74194.1 hypothetical protein G8A07_15570 [Roseateles sp. DAIF2]
MSASTAHPNNFLAPEPHIVARLQEALAGQQPAVHVLTEADLADVKEQAQFVPAVHVVWNGFRVLEAGALGRKARLEHTWLCVVAVRNVAGARNGAAARQEAGELIARVGAALAGFKPPNVYTPMQLAPGPRGGSSKGFMYVPLAFTVETIFSSQ